MHSNVMRFLLPPGINRNTESWCLHAKALYQLLAVEAPDCIG